MAARAQQDRSELAPVAPTLTRRASMRKYGRREKSVMTVSLSSLTVIISSADGLDPYKEICTKYTLPPLP